jgi:antitoxin component YwqK of YwqJK toxin-antitoxin module
VRLFIKLKFIPKSTENIYNHTMLTKINYKEYPEFMFAMIASFLPSYEGKYLRKVAGNVVFKSQDKEGRTYKNGLLHSYDDKPAVNYTGHQIWYNNGQIHREHDKPASVKGSRKIWYNNGRVHREGDNPAVIDGVHQEWYKNGYLHREGDNPAIMDGILFVKYYKNGFLHRDNNEPAVIDSPQYEWWVNGVFIKDQNIDESDIEDDIDL